MSGRVFLCIAGVFLVVFGGCRSSRQLYREGSFLYRDSMHCEQQERVDLRLLKLSALQTGVTVRKVELSPPDSLCRQFVRSVVWIEKQQTAEEKEVLLLSREATGEAVFRQMEERKEQIKIISRNSSFGNRVKLILFILIWAVVFVKLRNNRNH